MANFNGTNGDDVFSGGPEDDFAAGNGGNDTLSGGDGNDQLVGGSGSDTLNGDAGDDRIASFSPLAGNVWAAGSMDIYADFDVLNGGSGSDTLHAGYGDAVDGGDGFDRLYLNLLGATSGVTADFRLSSVTIGSGAITGIEWLTVQGSNFDDHLIASSYTTALFGGSGNDVLDGRGSSLVRLDGGSGNDTLYVDPAASTITFGGDGDDTIYSHGEVYGDDGNDTIILGPSSSPATVNGGNGNDHITGSAGADRIDGSFGADIILGGGGDDQLSAGFGDLDPDQLFGGEGNDTLSIQFGDSADGGAGTDSLSLDFSRAPTGIRLNTAAIISGQPYSFGESTFQSIEFVTTVTGSNFDDHFTIAGQGLTSTRVNGGEGNDVITAQDAFVTLYGDNGDDTFIVDGSSDIIEGGAGFDTVDYSLSASAIRLVLPEHSFAIPTPVFTGPGGD